MARGYSSIGQLLKGFRDTAATWTVRDNTASRGRGLSDRVQLPLPRVRQQLPAVVAPASPFVRACFVKAYQAVTPAAPWWAPFTYDVELLDGSGTKFSALENRYPHAHGINYQPAIQDGSYTNADQGFVYWVAEEQKMRCWIRELSLGDLFAVTVVKDGGVAGTMVTPTSCTFTYTVKDIDGTTLKKNLAGASATGMTPITPRYPSCEYILPTDNSPGVAYYKSDGTLVLYEVTQERVKGDTIQMFTDFRVNDATFKIQFKKTNVLVLDKADQDTGWTDYYTGANCP